MRKTCNFLLALLFVVLAAHSAQAQPPDKGEERGERVEALRVAFITQELNLTPEEAQQFWPLYNEMRKKLDALDDDMPPRPKGANKAAVSDKEAAEIIEKHLRREEERVKLKREYTEKFKKVISLQKILALHHAERQFKHQLMQRVQNHKGGGHHRGGHMPPPPAPPAPKSK